MDRSEQWDLDGICEICRKKDTCQVPCRAHKAREQINRCRPGTEKKQK